MELIKATTILPYASGLPRDVAETSLWFRNGVLSGIPPSSDDIIPENWQRVFTAVEEFWTADLPGLITSLSGFISTVVDRTAGAAKVRMVRFDTITNQEVGAPVFQPITLDNFAGGSPLPAEVALCMSFKSNANDGTPERRRRGRIYVGPLGEAHNEVVDGIGRPTDVLITAVNNAASRLQDTASDVLELNGVATPWVVYSRPTTAEWNAEHPGQERLVGDVHDVTDGWCDDEWDTQRRRGLDATKRVAWSS